MGYTNTASPTPLLLACTSFGVEFGAHFGLVIQRLGGCATRGLYMDQKVPGLSSSARLWAGSGRFDIRGVEGTRRFTGGIFRTVSLPAGTGSGHEDVDTANGSRGLGGRGEAFLLVFYGYLGAGNIVYEQAASGRSPHKRARMGADGAGEASGEEGTTIEA